MFRKHKIRSILVLLLLGFSTTGFFHSHLKSNPTGMDYRGEVYRIAEEDIRFLYDLTFQNAAGALVSEQQIFDTIFAGIDSAQQYILIDMFLFNSYGGASHDMLWDVAGKLTTRLVEKKEEVPEIRIDFITDPINNVYGGALSKEVEALRGAGINVMYTDLEPLRDSNLVYSPIWRTLFQWFGNSPQGGLFPHPLSQEEPGVTLRSYLILLNFKANHRKIFLADHHESVTTIISSANPHSGSSAHSNVALRIQGDFWQDVYRSESFVAEFSGDTLQEPRFAPSGDTADDTQGAVSVQLLTEEQIETELLSVLRTTTKGDRISIGAFYLSDREVMEALLRASQRGVAVRIILDPSKDAFGREKYGIPNQPAAKELITEAAGKIRIRWYDTHGEQFHAKFTLIETRDGRAHLFLGSANLTRRNLDNYNLELNVKVSAPSSAGVIRDISRYYERLWHNEAGNHYTVDYEYYDDRSLVKHVLYRVLEAGGLSTF